MRRTQSVSVGLSPSDFWGRFLFAPIFLLIFPGILLSPSLAQQKNAPAAAPAKHRSSLANPVSLTPELQRRIQTLELAKQSGDPVAVATAGKSVLGLALGEIGGIELVSGSPSAAIDVYRRSKDFENSPTTRIDLAQAYFATKRLDESLSLVTDVLVADSNDAHAWYLQGKLWMAKASYDEAVKSFEHVLALQDDPAASYLLGAALLQTKQHDQANAAFQKLQNPLADRATHRMLADAYIASNYMDDFKRESNQAGPGARESARHTSPIDSVLDDAAHLRSRFEPAIPTPKERVQNKHLQLELRTLLANTLNDLGTAEAHQGQYSLALAHFHEAASWDVNVPGLSRNTGIAAARVQDYPECIRALRPVIIANPQDNVARAMLGTAYFATHSYADAAQTFKPLGDSALQLHELAYSWAASLVYGNRYPEASDLLNKLEQQQLSTETLILVAQLWSQMGNYAKTVEICHRALDLDSKLPQAHYFAGLALLRLDRPAESAEELRAVLQLDPDNTEAQFNLAFTLLQQSQNAQAVELWKKVLARNPDHPEANYELGKELLTEGKPDESLSYLEASVRLKPQFDPAHYQLQSAYRAVGRKEDADREAKIYRELKTKNRNITLPPPRQAGTSPSSTD